MEPSGLDLFIEWYAAARMFDETCKTNSANLVFLVRTKMKIFLLLAVNKLTARNQIAQRPVDTSIQTMICLFKIREKGAYYL